MPDGVFRLGRGWRRGLQALQIIGSALRMRGSLKDGVLVFGQDFEPVADVVGMVFPDVRGDAKVGTKKGGAQFRDEFLAGIARVAETLTAEVSIETCCVGAWWYCKHPTGGALLLWLAATAGLTLINGNGWACASFAVLAGMAYFVTVQIPRASRFFYLYYPAHLAVLLLMGFSIPRHS